MAQRRAQAADEAHGCGGGVLGFVSAIRLLCGSNRASARTDLMTDSRWLDAIRR